MLVLNGLDERFYLRFAKGAAALLNDADDRRTGGRGHADMVVAAGSVLAWRVGSQGKGIAVED